MSFLLSSHRGFILCEFRILKTYEWTTDLNIYDLSTIIYPLKNGWFLWDTHSRQDSIVCRGCFEFILNWNAFSLSFYKARKHPVCGGKTTLYWNSIRVKYVEVWIYWWLRNIYPRLSIIIRGRAAGTIVIYHILVEYHYTTLVLD